MKQLFLLGLLALGSYGYTCGSAVTTRSHETITALCEAVRANDVAVVRSLLEAGAALDTQGPDGLAPLHIAARKSSIECANLLFEHRASADLISATGKNALAYAIEEGTPECVSLFIKGGDPAPDINFGMAQILFRRLYQYVKAENFELAAKWSHSHPDILLLGAILSDASYSVRTLITHFGAKPNACLQGVTALILALSRNDTKILKALISSGANVHEKSNGYAFGYDDIQNSMIPFSSSLGHGTQEIQYPFRKHSPLFFACMNGQLQAVELFLKAGADVNQHSTRSPLWAACLQGNPALVSLLIEAGADLDEGALLVACERYITSDKPSAESGHFACVTQLLDAGSNPQVLLRITLCNRHHSLLEYLLARGANANSSIMCPTELMSLINFALFKRDALSYAILRRNGARIDERSLTYAIDAQLDAIAQELLEEGMPLQKKDHALHKVAQRGSAHLVAKLLKRGVPVNQLYKDSRLQTNLPTANELGFALQSHSSESVRLLLEAGSDPRSVMDPGEAPYVKKPVNALEFALKRNPLALIMPQPIPLPNIKELIKQSFRIFRPTLEDSVVARKVLWSTLRLLRKNDIPLFCVIAICRENDAMQRRLIDVCLSDLNDDQRFAPHRLRMSLDICDTKKAPIRYLEGLIASTQHFKDYDHEQFTLQTRAKPFVIEYLFEKVMACAAKLLPDAYDVVKPLFTTEEGQQEIRALIEQGVNEAFEKMLITNRNHCTL